MPCGQRCKELIDTWNATVMSGNCMVASVLLTAQTSDGPSAELVEEFRRQARRLAETAQSIASQLTPAAGAEADPLAGT